MTEVAEVFLFMLVYAINGALVYICAVTLHELGHFFMARKFDKKAFITVKYVGRRLTIYTSWVSGSRKQNKRVFATGVVFGLLPIFSFGVFFWGYIFVVIPYLMGLSGDLDALEEKP